MPRKSAAKRSLHRLGYRIEKIEPSEETIPVDYDHSPFLPRVYRGALDRYLYFKGQLEQCGR